MVVPSFYQQQCASHEGRVVAWLNGEDLSSDFSEVTFVQHFPKEPVEKKCNKNAGAAPPKSGNINKKKISTKGSGTRRQQQQRPTTMTTQQCSRSSSGGDTQPTVAESSAASSSSSGRQNPHHQQPSPTRRRRQQQQQQQLSQQPTSAAPKQDARENQKVLTQHRRPCSGRTQRNEDKQMSKGEEIVLPALDTNGSDSSPLLLPSDIDRVLRTATSTPYSPPAHLDRTVSNKIRMAGITPEQLELLRATGLEIKESS